MRGGAAAVSVMPNLNGFGFADIRVAARALRNGQVPAMRKDSSRAYQVAEERLAGAGGVLVMCACSSPRRDALLEAAERLGMLCFRVRRGGHRHARASWPRTPVRRAVLLGVNAATCHVESGPGRPSCGG